MILLLLKCKFKEVPRVERNEIILYESLYQKIFQYNDFLKFLLIAILQSQDWPLTFSNHFIQIKINKKSRIWLFHWLFRNSKNSDWIIYRYSSGTAVYYVSHFYCSFLSKTLPLLELKRHTKLHFSYMMLSYL